MSARRGWVAAVLLLAATSAVVRAGDDGLPQSLTLQQAFQLLEEKSPRTAAERAQVDVVAAERIEAERYPNPSISYGGLGLVSGANTGSAMEHQIVVEQPVLLFGERDARREAAELNIAAERARVAANLAERRRLVREAFASLLARQEEVRALEESAADLERVEQLVKGRAAAGDRSQYDVARIETESRLLAVELANARTAAEQSSRTLAAVLGFPGWTPRAEGTLEPDDVETDFPRLWELAQRQRPSLRALRERQAAAVGGLNLARRERWPVPAIAAGALVTQDEDSVSAYFGFSLPLPLFDRNQGAIAKASAELEAQRLALDAALAEARAEIERAHSVLVKHREALASLEHDVVQRIPALRRMAEDAYREGQSGILELLDAFRSLKEIRLRHLQQQENVRLSEAAVIAAAGLDVPPPGE